MQALSPLSTPQRRNTAPIRRSVPAGLQQRRIQRSNAAAPVKLTSGELMTMSRFLSLWTPRTRLQ
ncbi:hypothetical protein AVEN_120029-1, partial [Araneus ventricosus]